MGPPILTDFLFFPSSPFTLFWNLYKKTMEPKCTDPTAGGQGDPWDHPEFLASIDNLCSKHFRFKNRSDTFPPLNTRPKNPLCSASLTQLSADPEIGKTPPSLLERVSASSSDKLKSSHEDLTLLGTGFGGRTSQPGSRFSELPPFHKVSGFRKRTQKVWKPKRKHPKLVLGMDIGLSEACNLALCALVGRLAYKEKCNQKLEDWIAI
jgi:hypothetical protein